MLKPKEKSIPMVSSGSAQGLSIDLVPQVPPKRL
jgi:hypothetical protein